MAQSLLEIANSITLSGGRLSSGIRYSIGLPSRILSSQDAYKGNDDCDCHAGDCSDCYCTDCNEGHCE